MSRNSTSRLILKRKLKHLTSEHPTSGNTTISTLSTNQYSLSVSSTPHNNNIRPKATNQHSEPSTNPDHQKTSYTKQQEKKTKERKENRSLNKNKGIKQERRITSSKAHPARPLNNGYGRH